MYKYVSAILAIALILVSLAYAQETIYIPYHGENLAPAVQIDARGNTPNIALLVGSEVGTGIHSSATQDGGVGIWAVGINGAEALKVQGDADFFHGRILKDRTEGHRIKLYDPDTGDLMGSFEYSLE